MRDVIHLSLGCIIWVYETPLSAPIIDRGVKMKIGFDLKESAYEGTLHFGKLILEAGEDTVSINISTRKNDKGDLYICLPSK